MRLNFLLVLGEFFGIGSDYFADIISMKGEYFIVLLCHLPNERFWRAAKRSKMRYSRTLNTGKGEFKANLRSLTKVSDIS